MALGTSRDVLREILFSKPIIAYNFLSVRKHFGLIIRLIANDNKQYLLHYLFGSQLVVNSGPHIYSDHAIRSPVVAMQKRITFNWHCCAKIIAIHSRRQTTSLMFTCDSGSQWKFIGRNAAIIVTHI